MWHFTVVQESLAVHTVPPFVHPSTSRTACCTKTKIANYIAAENLVSSEMLLLDAIGIPRMANMQKSRFLLLTRAKRICHFLSTNRIAVQRREIQAV